MDNRLYGGVSIAVDLYHYQDTFINTKTIEYYCRDLLSAFGLMQYMCQIQHTDGVICTTIMGSGYNGIDSG